MGLPHSGVGHSMMSTKQLLCDGHSPLWYQMGEGAEGETDCLGQQFNIREEQGYFGKGMSATVILP